MAVRKSIRKPVEKHGMTGTREYRAWADMITRCTNPKFIKYHYYGGKGIKVCKEWRMSFVSFFNHMGRCPAKHTLDRIDSSKNYEPGNCRWVTQSRQMRNQCRNRLLTFNGKTQCLTDWAVELGMTYSQIQHRLERGMDLGQALTHKNRRGRLIAFNGKTQNIKQWSRETGIKPDAILVRLDRLGWSIEKSLTTPSRKKKCNRPSTSRSRELPQGQ